MLFVVVGCLFCKDAKAQIQYYPILIESKGIFKQTVYTRCNVEMNSEQLLKLFAKDPNMNNYVVPMAKLNLVHRILFTSGTVLVGIPLVDSLQKKNDINWNLAYVGAGCIAASIPFKIALRKKNEKAINYYNLAYKEANRIDAELKLGKNGIGISLNF